MNRQAPVNCEIVPETDIHGLVLFSALFSFGMTPLQRVYATEVFKFENRAKAIALQGLLGTVTGCITQFGLPPMLEHLGYKSQFHARPVSLLGFRSLTPGAAYFVFMAFDIIGIIIMYLYVVETKQLSLEDLDEVFESPNPKKTSLQLVKDAKIMAKREREALSGQA